MSAIDKYCFVIGLICFVSLIILFTARSVSIERAKTDAVFKILDGFATRAADADEETLVKLWEELKVFAKKNCYGHWQWNRVTEIRAYIKGRYSVLRKS